MAAPGFGFAPGSSHRLKPSCLRARRQAGPGSSRAAGRRLAAPQAQGRDLRPPAEACLWSEPGGCAQTPPAAPRHIRTEPRYWLQVWVVATGCGSGLCAPGIGDHGSFNRGRSIDPPLTTRAIRPSKPVPALLLPAMRSSADHTPRLAHVEPWPARIPRERRFSGDIRDTVSRSYLREQPQLA